MTDELARCRTMRQWFDFLDEDGSGEIGVNELAVPLLSMGFATSISQVELMIEKVDSDGSGEIDVHELGALVKEIGVECSEEELRGLVDEVDDDGSGEIGFHEFVVLVKKMMMENAEMMAVMDGSKKAELALKAQRERDSGARVMWE